MLRLILLLSIMIAGCTRPIYRATICPKDASSCAVGAIQFDSLEECERWAKEVSRVQVNTVRICFKQY
jgi:hypothetical protein